MKNPFITIIIPTHNRAQDVIELITSIKQSDYNSYQIVVVDDASDDGTPSIINQTHQEVGVLTNLKNLGAAASKNIGIKKYLNLSDYLLFLDSDEIIEKDTITKLVEVLSRHSDKIAAVTPSVYYFEKPEKKQYGHVAVGLITGINYSKKDKHPSKPWSVKSCGGNLLIKKEMIKKVGLFDENFHVFYEDADYSLRIIKAGYKIFYVPQAKVYHKTPFYNKKQATQKWLSHAYLTARNKLIFLKKHSPCFLLSLLFYPIYIVFYTFKALKYQDSLALKEYWRGVKDGLKWAFSKK